MAKIKVTGDTLMVISEIKHEEFVKAKKYNPEILKLKDEDGNEQFAVNYGNASIGEYGVTFSSVNAEGYLFTSGDAPVQGVHEDLEKEKEMVIEEYASVLCKLTMVEKQVKTAMEDIQKFADAVAENVTIE